LALPTLSAPTAVDMPSHQPLPAFSSPERLTEWMYTYRSHKSPWRVPEAVQAMYELGLLDDDDKRGYCTGFIAGVLGETPKSADALITKMFRCPISSRPSSFRRSSIPGARIGAS
jgi:hypothetical protein